MPARFDAVVVGSGFGGSVMAYRLALAGLKVCVLERGKAYPPGSFPRSPFAMAQNFWDPSEGMLGMFDIWSFAGTEAVVASGLGGGSLIYANVLIRKPAEWFVDRDPRTGAEVPWPVTRSDLDPHYDRVEKVLNGQEFPLNASAAYAIPKTLALQALAAKLGMQWYLPKLAVTFRNGTDPPSPGVPITPQYPNLHDAVRLTCRLCGECDVGCNYGSKNTVDYNYLSMAKMHGAEIRTLHEVRSLRPRQGGGYEVDFVVHDPARMGHKTATAQLPIETVFADKVILSAGTLGSTYLLLKCRSALPGLSSRLGERFSTNGDLLTFAVHSSEGDGQRREARLLDPSRGPVITSTFRGNLGQRGGFFIQDAGYPQFVNWILETSNAPSKITRAVLFLWRRLMQWVTHEPYDEVSGRIAAILGPCALSSGTMPLLGMGRDVPDGLMTLERGSDGQQYLQVSWRNVRSKEFFDALRDTSRKVAEGLGARFVQNPDTEYLNRLVTVHALGGCSMGKTIDEGVVDPFGEVFGHKELYVADGSIMPGPTGSNPSLTIAALADRAADHIVSP